MERHSAYRIAALVCVSATLAITSSLYPASAQDVGLVGNSGVQSADAQMLLQADELVYDSDNSTITAQGSVRIDYDGTRLVAERIVYREDTGRLVAIGNVEVLQPDGTRAFADEIDITDNFRDGFVNALRVVTPDKTRFSAESAIRENGSLTTFNNGSYTACSQCPKHPDRPPLWQIKAQKIIWNGEEQTIRFERATFEFFGVPLASVPVFTTADPSVKRKTGFLAPNFRYAEELGFGLRAPYFINLAPNRDLTLAATGYTKQGFLAEAEYRHRLENGVFTLKTAGIHQFDPDAFAATEVDSTVTNRGMIGTTGDFDINDRWSFGWNGMLQSDADFSRTYNISGFNSSTVENHAYLTGIGDRSYFDARLIHFDVQSADLTSTSEEQQAIILPSVDYNYTLNQPVFGGELSFDINTRGSLRSAEDNRKIGSSLASNPSIDPTASNFATPGVESDSWRLTAQTEWQRTFIAPGGLAITPMLHAQADSYQLYGSTSAQYSSTMDAAGVSLADNGNYFRGMVTAGLELRYPILFSAASSTHVLEPIGQVFVRPDEQAGNILPNEDAQSLVFDAASLFERDKFSGYDRIEGGTRANVGLRYTGTFDNGWGINGVFGQSYHLAGLNSFTVADTFNTGANSGLETDVSDYVGALTFTAPGRFSFGVGGRFDEKTFEVRRAEAFSAYTGDALRLSTRYAYIDSQPQYGFENERHEISAAGSLALDENWSVFGSATYDLSNDVLDKYTAGISYECDCFTVKAQYTEDRKTTGAIDRSYGFYITLRTLGELGTDSNVFD